MATDDTGHRALSPDLAIYIGALPLYPSASPVADPMASATRNMQFEQHTRLHESRQRSFMSSSTPPDCPTHTAVSLVTQPVGKHDAQEHVVLPLSEEMSMHL